MAAEKKMELLEGRQGAEGYIIRREEWGEIICRGLAPGEAAALYRLEAGGALLCLEQKADGTGAWRGSWQGSGNVFLARGGQVLLWEKCKGREESFLRACAGLSSAQRQPDIAGSDHLPLRAVHSLKRRPPIREKMPEKKTTPEDRPLPAWFAAAKVQREQQKKRKNGEEKPRGIPVDGLPQR